MSIFASRFLAACVMCFVAINLEVEAFGRWKIPVTYHFPEELRQRPITMKLVRGLHPIVKVTINETRKAHILVDTGASVTYLPATWFGKVPRQGFWLKSLCFDNRLCLRKIPVMADNCNYTHQPQIPITA